MCGKAFPHPFGCGAACSLSVPDRTDVLFGLAPPRQLRGRCKREYGGAVNGVKGVTYALCPSFSVASCCVGSVDAVTLYAISPPR